MIRTTQGILAGVCLLLLITFPRSDASAASPRGAPATPPPALVPPVPKDVTHLDFGEFFRAPVGPRGLELSDKLQGLDGQRVRLLGYMVRQGQPTPWKLLLAPVPQSSHEREYGLAEDLPPQLVHVATDRTTPPIVPYTPGPLLLTGTLSVGNRDEADGRVSLVRLRLDPPSAADRKNLASHAQGSRSLPLSTNSTPPLVAVP